MHLDPEYKQQQLQLSARAMDAHRSDVVLEARPCSQGQILWPWP